MITTLKQSLIDMLKILMKDDPETTTEELDCQFYATQTIYRESLDRGLTDEEICCLGNYALSIREVIDRHDNRIIDTYLDRYMSKYADSEEPCFHQAANFAATSLIAERYDEVISEDIRELVDGFRDYLAETAVRIHISHIYGHSEYESFMFRNETMSDIIRSDIMLVMALGGEVDIVTNTEEGYTVCPLRFKGNFAPTRIPVEHAYFYEMKYKCPLIPLPEFTD